MIIISYAEYEDAELRRAGGHEPTVVHVDTANRPIPEALAKQFASERGYIEVVPAELDPRMQAPTAVTRRAASTCIGP